MFAWKLIREIRFKQFVDLLFFFFKHPIFTVLSILATLKTLKIAQQKFPNIHGNDNKANAFRHALWNALIARNCFKSDKDLEKVIAWTKEITDWHEEVFINEALARAMDLHNNVIGRAVFKQHSSITEKELIVKLEEMMQESIWVNSLKEIDYHPEKMVYINKD